MMGSNQAKNERNGVAVIDLSNAADHAITLLLLEVPPKHLLKVCSLVTFH